MKKSHFNQHFFISMMDSLASFQLNCVQKKLSVVFLCIVFCGLYSIPDATAAVTFRSAASASTATLSSGSGITHVGAGTPDVRNGCGNITPSIPAGNTNDLLIALAIAKEDDGGNDITMPNWNTYYSATYPGNPPDNNELQVRIYWRIATGSDSNIITQSGSQCDAFAGQISRFRGVDTANPFETATPGVVTQDSGNIDTGTIVTSSANAMLLVAGFVSDNRTVSEGAGWLESFDYSYNAGGSKPDLDVTLNYQLQTTAGSKSISNWSLSGGNTDENFGVIFALKPGSSAASGGLTINVPAATTANDVMIASVSTAPSTITITPPAGWTLIRQVTQTNTNSSKLSSYYKVATGTEPASYTWTLSSAGFNGAAGGIASFIGVDTSTPVDAEAGTATASSRDHVAPSVNTTLADGMLVTVHELASSATWTTPTGMTEMVDVASLTPTDADGISIEMNYEARPTAGATGTRSARSSANAGPNRDFGATQSISLKPYVSTLACFTDDFNRANGSPGTSWVVSSNSGTFGNPVIFNNRLRLTDASGNAATMATLQQIFPGAGNRIEVEFDFYDYGGSGADGIAVTLSDYSVTPVPGGYGGSLGYAQRTGINGFAGGWLGVGLDEYGNFSNPTEGRSGGPGFRRDSISIRGSGSGTTGYAYHDGTAANLVPEVDNNGTAVPAHRYRIIIDHSNGVNAWVSVERNTGSGYVMLVAPYDAKAKAGQAAVPTNWILSYTGSTGGSTNVHEIDNLSVCATAQTPVSSFHHFEIDHDGTALTCNPEQVTIRACNNASCTPPHYASPIDVTLSPSGWVGGDTQTIPAGTLTPSLAIRTAGTQSLNITSSTVIPTSGLAATICKNTSTGATGVIGSAACNLTFSDTGFISTIPTQTSCATSASITLQAVRLDATTQTCVPAFQNVNRNLKIWASYSDPAPGAIIGTPAVSLVNGNGTYTLPSTEPATANVPMSFAGSADETFTITYPDAGQLVLNTKYDGSAANSDTGLIMLGSNTFVVSPAKLYVYSDDTNAACPSNDASCSAFLSVSTPFNLKIRAACADNTKTPNFVLNNIPVSHLNTAPAVAQGIPGITSFDMTPGDQGEHIINNQTVSEVGVFTFTATSPAYLGVTGPTGTSTYIGRFYPHHFDTTVIEGCTISNNYTYSGQPFSVAATAMNNLSPTPTPTQNYTGTFAFDTTLSNAAITPIINFNATNIIPAASYTNGTASKLDVAYTFPTKDTIPETITLRANDADTGTSIGITEGTTEIRSGRMRFENVYGSELTPLTMPLKVEFYSDNTLILDPSDDGFILNTDDSCTVYDATAGALTNYTGNLSAGETTLTGAGAIAAGVASINFSAPGAGNEGTVNLLANNANTVLPWLTYSWNVDCDNADGDNDITTGIDAGLCGPVATTSFGLYRGDDRVIYWREVF